MLDGLSHINKTYSPFCVTFARGLEEPEMLLRFGGDPSLAWPLPCGDILALQDLLVERDPEEFEGLDIFEETDTPVIQVGQCGDWVFSIEYYGWMHGLRPEVLRVVSAGTVAVSVYRDVNALTILSYAEDGVFLEQFEASNTIPLRLQTVLRQAGVDPISEDWNTIQLMSALVEALGIRLDQEALAKPLLTAMVDPSSQVR